MDHGRYQSAGETVLQLRKELADLKRKHEASNGSIIIVHGCKHALSIMTCGCYIINVASWITVCYYTGTSSNIVQQPTFQGFADPLSLQQKTVTVHNYSN